MENMNKELTVPKWVLIVQPKIPQMPQNILSGCPESVGTTNDQYGFTH